jgi:hypothetical protein
LLEEIIDNGVFFGEFTDDAELPFASIDDEQIRKELTSDRLFREFCSSDDHFFQRLIIVRSTICNGLDFVLTIFHLVGDSSSKTGKSSTDVASSEMRNIDTFHM